MKIVLTKHFSKIFHKNISDKYLQNQFWITVEIFKNDPFDARLKTHKLTGKLSDLWSFSVSYDIRVIFYFSEDNSEAVFVDIGTHNQVY